MIRFLPHELEAVLDTLDALHDDGDHVHGHHDRGHGHVLGTTSILVPVIQIWFQENSSHGQSYRHYFHHHQDGAAVVSQDGALVSFGAS